MKPEHHQQIRVWISEEIAALRARGATDADMHEEAFIALVGEKILEHHAAPELSKALIIKGLRTASPETIRQQAALSRERGNADLAGQQLARGDLPELHRPPGSFHSDSTQCSKHPQCAPASWPAVCPWRRPKA